MAPLTDTFQKALALHRAGRLGEAQALYRLVLEREPRHFDSLHLLGLATIAQGGAEAGAALIRQALAVKPDSAPAHYNLGNALLTLGQPEAALASFTRALELDPSDAQCHFEAANALKELGRGDEAIVRYGRAIGLEPGAAEMHNNLGVALKDAGRLEEAVASYDRAIALKPRYAEAHSNRGNALRELGRLAEALACQDTAIGLRPGYAEAHYNRANLLVDLKRHDEALAGFDAALALRPHYAEAQHNKSQLLLGRGRFREGFALYGSRWRTPNFNIPALAGGVPRWDGKSGAGSVLVWPEQGIGDEIFHASLLPLAPREGVRITLAADPRLHAIYRRSFPDLDIIGSEVLEGPAGGHDAQVPVGDLGDVLAVDAEKLAARAPSFLVADAGRSAALRAARGFPTSGPVVGLSWRSSNKKFGAEKSLGLADLAPVLTLPGLSFVKLQYGEVTEDIAQARSALGVDVHEVEGLDVYNDIDGLLALVAACDLVVTTSNITAHLAGAIGKKGVVLVPAGKGCLWYWQGGPNDLWYPSLTRAAQPRIGDWQPAIAAAAAWVRDNT